MRMPVRSTGSHARIGMTCAARSGPPPTGRGLPVPPDPRVQCIAAVLKTLRIRPNIPTMTSLLPTRLPARTAPPHRWHILRTRTLAWCVEGGGRQSRRHLLIHCGERPSLRGRESGAVLRAACALMKSEDPELCLLMGDLNYLSQRGKHHLPIDSVSNNRLTAAPAADHMVSGPRKLNADLAGHG